MKIKDIVENRGPANPSRRSFLKKAAALGALAAMPKSLATATAPVEPEAPSIANFLTQEEEGAFLNIPVNREFGGVMVRSINMFIGTMNDDPDDGEYSFSDGYLMAEFDEQLDYNDERWPYTQDSKQFLEDMRAFLKEKQVLPNSVIDQIDFNESGEQDNEYASFDAGEVAGYVRDQLGVETGGNEPDDDTAVDVGHQVAKSAVGSAVRSQASLAPTMAGFKDLVQRVLRLSTPTEPTQTTQTTEPTVAALPAPDKSSAEIMAQLRDIVGHDLTDAEKEIVYHEIKRDV